MQRKRHMFGAFVVIAVLTFGAALPASAAESPRVTKKTACKVLTKADIARLLGATATSQGNARKGPDTVCRWSVAAAGDRPSGDLKIGVSFEIPPGAYDALKNNPQYQVVDGLGVDALYQPQVATLTLFKGNRILTLRGTFFDATVRPIRSYDPKAELMELAKAADTRL